MVTKNLSYFKSLRTKNKYKLNSNAQGACQAFHIILKRQAAHYVYTMNNYHDTSSVNTMINASLESPQNTTHVL